LAGRLYKHAYIVNKAWSYGVQVPTSNLAMPSKVTFAAQAEGEKGTDGDTAGPSAIGEAITDMMAAE
jgi:hypothetical protein